MKQKSHQALGCFLEAAYLQNVPRAARRAFLFGCTQPDRNPITYCKGSIRCNWLRGHNYENAAPWMAKLCNRLESKVVFSLWDYYSLGKLIHYTADAFTYAHNSAFPKNIAAHRTYESMLEADFLNYIKNPPEITCRTHSCLWPAIAALHQQYWDSAPSQMRDCRYIFMAANFVMRHMAQAFCTNELIL